MATPLHEEAAPSKRKPQEEATSSRKKPQEAASSRKKEQELASSRKKQQEEATPTKQKTPLKDGVRTCLARVWAAGRGGQKLDYI